MNEVRSSGRRAIAAMACLVVILACAESCGSAGGAIGCPTGRVTLGDSCVSPAGTARVPDTSTATGAAVIDLGDTGARLIVPPGASSAPLDVQWSVHALTADEQAVDGQALLPQEIELGPSGTVFNAPLVLELPMSWPSGYDAMTTGVRVVWAPAYARSSGVLGRDTLRSFDAHEGGAGWVVLDATRAPRKATALALLDHFSSHTLVIPSPSLEFDGQAAFSSQTVTGSIVPLTVPTGLFTHGMFDILALDDPYWRRTFYGVELLELVRQTTPTRNALFTVYDDVFTHTLVLTDGASPTKKLDDLAKALATKVATVTSGDTKKQLKNLAAGFGRMSKAMAKVTNASEQLKAMKCLSDGALQLWVVTSLDDALVGARWSAVRAKLLGSPLGKGDTALQQAIADVDFKLSIAASDTFLDNLVTYIVMVSESLTVPACIDVLAVAAHKIVSKAVVDGLVSYALATSEATFATTLGAATPAAAAAYQLIEDWVTKDVFKAAQNGERLAILASLLKDGTLGAFPDLGSKITVDSSGLTKVTVPDVLDYTDAASAPYLRLQVATYAQSTIYDTISSVVKREDMSELTQYFDTWKNDWCFVSTTCPSGLGIDLLAASFDQASWSNEKARQSLVATFAACAMPGACASTCDDPDKDGYGVGLACIGPATSPSTGPSCSDGKKNQDESGVDCGGVCPACSANSCPSGNGFYCGQPALSQNAQYLYVCQDGDYTFSSTCNGQGCQVSAPGVDDACAAKAATCSDGLQNQGETGVDCGGPCQSCPMMGCPDGVCSGGETCSSCPQDCGACAPTCPDGQCNGGETCATCPQDCGACACGGSGQACCAANSCNSPYQCAGGTCGCGAGNNGQFNVTDHVYPNFGAPGCSGDNTLKLKASAAMVSPTVLRVYIRKADDSLFTSGGTLSLYVGNGPTCPNPPNIVKTTKPVVNGVQEQTIDLSVNPYSGAWNLNEVKTFWVGKDEGGFQSWRASGFFSVSRICM